MCFLNAVYTCLKQDYPYYFKNLTISEMQNACVNELITEGYSYIEQFHTDLPADDKFARLTELINVALEFFREPKKYYSQQILDICIPVCAKVLDLVLLIYLEHNGNTITIKQGQGSYLCTLLYTKGIQGNDMCAHYDAIIMHSSSPPCIPLGGDSSDDDSSDLEVTYFQEGDGSYSSDAPDVSIIKVENCSSPSNLQHSSPPSRSKLKSSGIGQLRVHTVPNSYQFHRSRSRHRIVLDSYSSAETFPAYKVPHVPSGRKKYTIVCEDAEYKFRTLDGYWWLTRGSDIPGGKKRSGFCMGSNVCVNPACTFLDRSRERYRNGDLNCGNFYGRRSKPPYMSFCQYCFQAAEFVVCYAERATTYTYADKILNVYYDGYHNCHPSEAPAAEQELIEIIRGRQHLGPKGIAVASILEAMSSPNWDNVDRVANLTTNLNRIKNTKRKHFPNESVNRLARLEWFQLNSKKQDEFLLFAFNLGDNSTMPSFTWQSEKHFIDIAFELDESGPNLLFNKRPVFLDTMHKRVEGWKTITLWVQHPLTRKIVPLAIMDSEAEDSYMLTLFLILLNKAISQRKGFDKEREYRFNPKNIMCDFAGANRNAVGLALGKHKVNCVIGCQWHFDNEAKKHGIAISLELRPKWRSVCQSIVRSATFFIYQERMGQLRDMAKTVKNTLKVKELLRWLDYWDEHRWMLVDCLREGAEGITLPRSNLAENAQSGLQLLSKIGKSSTSGTPLRDIVESVKINASNLVHEAYTMQSVLNGETKSFGNAPSPYKLAKRKAIDSDERTLQYCQTLASSCIGMKDTRKCHSKPVKQAPLDIVPYCSTRTQKTQTRNFFYQQLPFQRSGPTTLPLDTPDCMNPPYLCFRFGNVSVCHGCTDPIKVKASPDDLVFVMYVRRLGPTNVNGQLKYLPQKFLKRAYFHIDKGVLSCVRNARSSITHSDVRVSEQIWRQLDAHHRDKLKRLKLYDHLDNSIRPMFHH